MKYALLRYALTIMRTRGLASNPIGHGALCNPAQTRTQRQTTHWYLQVSSSKALGSRPTDFVRVRIRSLLPDCHRPPPAFQQSPEFRNTTLSSSHRRCIPRLLIAAAAAAASSFCLYNLGLRSARCGYAPKSSLLVGLRFQSLLLVLNRRANTSPGSQPAMRPKFTPAVRKKSASTSASAAAAEGGASSSSAQPARKKPVNPDEAIDFFNRAADVYRDIASVADDGGRRKKGAEDGDGDGDGEGGRAGGRKKRKSEGGVLSEEEVENGENGSLTDKKKERNDGEEDDEDIDTVRKKLRAVRAQRRWVAASISLSPWPRAGEVGSNET